MSTFYGISSDSSASFFNNYFSSTSSTSNSSSGVSSMLTDYYSIKNGSYGKLVKAYYAQEDSEEATSDTEKSLTIAQNDASSLKSSSIALTQTDSDSVFKKISKKDNESGETSLVYDTDAIYKGVNSFVEDYNSVVETASETDINSVLKKALWMVNGTDTYETELKNVGITINSDNTLSIDEKKFKAADMNEVKSIFNGSQSLSASVYQKASDIYNLINSQINNGSTYSNSGSYTSLTTGNLFDSLF